IFYGNWQDSDKAIVNDFLSGLGTSSFWNISTKYYNYNLTENGEPGPKKYVSSTVKLGKSASDPNRSLGTWLNSGNSSNFDDILAIVQNHIHSGELPADGDGIYLVLTDEETVEGDYCKSYCGCDIVFANGTFNSSLNLSAPDYIYAFIGNSKACGPNGIFSCGTNNFFVSPNGSPHIDQMLSPIAHEIAEAASNPDVTADTTAWNDVADGVNDGSENGDNCAYIFGSQAKHDHGGGYFYNQEWNGRKYFIQQLWDPDTQ
ncbi:phosphate-induced protein 1, partial [Zopfochytrium polystomum]